MASENLLNAWAQRRPILLENRKVPAQIQHRDLTNSLPDAFSAHQVVSEVGFPGGNVAGEHATYVHAPQSIGHKSQRGCTAENIMAPQNDLPNHAQ